MFNPMFKELLADIAGKDETDETPQPSRAERRAQERAEKSWERRQLKQRRRQLAAIAKVTPPSRMAAEDRERYERLERKR